MTEVGISLALRRQNKLFQSEKKPTKRKENNNATTTLKSKRRSHQKAGKTTTRTTRTSPPNNKNSSWQIFVEVVALYGLCLVLPNIVSFGTRWLGENLFFLNWIGVQLCSLPYISSLQWCIRNYHNIDVNSDSSSSLRAALAPDAGISDVAIVVFLSLSMAVVRLTLVHFLVPDYNQPKRLRALVRCKSIHLLSSSYPGTLTPTQSSVRGMKKLDSIDLSSLAMLPDLSVPPNNNNGNGSESDNNSQSDQLLLNSRPMAPPGPFITGTFDDNSVNVDDDNSSSSSSFRIEKSIEKMKKLTDAEGLLTTINSSLTVPKRNDDDITGDNHDMTNNLSGGHDDDDVDDNDSWFINYDETDDQAETEEANEDLTSAPAVSSGLLTSSSAQSLQALLQQATPMPEAAIRRSSISNEDAVRVFAAPKYATAAFRLLFSSVSCMIALIYFRDAEFWPPAVGGNGSTKNCWDLSSVGAAVMESDFDHHNTVLRHYYLFQASYHFHSGAFHVLAALLLWFVSAKNKEQKASIFSSGLMTLDNVRSLFQHSFSVGLIAGTYLFSSLRRLMAIGMFAFDLSSLFLHLIQLLINSPKESWRISPKWIRILHRGLVIPAFCYTRFYVFPFVIAYSAFEESGDWLRQLENMWITGTAKYIHNLFVVSFSMLMVMNFVYVKRLMYHPHVRDTLDDKRK